MFSYMKYGPYICIGAVLAILFVLWAFWGGKNYEFVGLAPLDPTTCGSYTGSLYNWGNITPAVGYDPIEGHTCIPPDVACVQEMEDITSHIPQPSQPNIVIDNTPIIQHSFQSDVAEIPVNTQVPICPVRVGLPKGQAGLQVDPLRVGLPKRKGRFISRGERMCCQTMERIYGVPFSSIWPTWLVNPETGSKLELDCYNDDLKIAVEYNGEQHYTWPNFTNQTHEQFINQVRRDVLKVELCERNGVYLIVVPFSVDYDDIPGYIMSHLPETLQKRLRDEKTLSNING